MTPSERAAWAADVAWLLQRQRFGMQPGLARIRRLLDALGSPDASMAIALVAGTNGKGSTTALLANMLAHESGRVVGRFISPHLTHFNERFWMGQGPMADARLAPVLARVRHMPEAADATFFELLVALALRAFADAGVTHAVLEVGIGGRWDATNATEPELTLITSIDLDHQEILGDTVEKIAAEKAGVMRAGRTTITSAQGAARRVLDAHARQLGAVLRSIDDEPIVLATRGWDGVEAVFDDTLVVRAPLLGAHQARNLATAVRAAQAWGLSNGAMAAGAAAVSWPGRCEVVRPLASNVTYLLDGAHNPAGARALAATLAALQLRPAALLLGLTEERLGTDLASTLAALAPQVVVVRAPTSARAADPAALARALANSQAQVHIAANLSDALARVEALATAANAPVLVAGSLYLVGDVRAVLLGESTDTAERWQ
jgi:dihydrofolate synthase/folylpolyglutamate synthase